MSTTSVVVRHNFETAHRLFTQPKGTKCWSLHGHSFWAEIAVACEALDERGMVIEYGELKRAVRDHIDKRLDHGAVLNHQDPLCAFLAEQDCKVLLLETDPTVEALAGYLYVVVTEMLPALSHGDSCWVAQVTVQETHVNAATVHG